MKEKEITISNVKKTDISISIVTPGGKVQGSVEAQKIDPPPKKG